ncbi:UNKNOWN [Stylonychia lemnae]|uniref:Tldc domain-containing protein n=1 Tax=Stylonychia lemnae TaxID=5949 RepID=A0A078A184_STYLE|nr:UNKNOWN [Stylonychia lemnae]|eukprot:CDW74544.1 UNKNOWN [Stylonychia lemnae]
MESESKCEQCNELFNSIDKQQIILPCGDSICLSCFGKALEPEESKLICPIDKEALIITKKFREKIQKMTQQKNKLLWILCQNHLDLIAEYYCNTHREMVCHLCAHKGHANHAKKLDLIVDKDIQGFCERALERLNERRSKINDLIDEIEIFKQKERSYPSEVFIKILREVQDSLIPHLDKKGGKELELKNNGKRCSADDFSEETLSVFNITDDHEELLKVWIHGEDEMGSSKFELLYKATRDTFSSAKMHEMINNKGPIVGIIKSQHDQVFGGYSSVGWKADGAWTLDGKAFIFSLTKKTKHEQYQNKDQALYYANSFMLWFGYDILLYTDCNNNASSYSNFGTTYKPPDGIVQGQDSANTYLAGSHYFSVKEIEVYKVSKEE